MISRRYTRQAVLVGCCLLDDIHRILDDRVYLRIVLLHVTLSQFEQRTLRLLHQVVYIHRLIERLCLDVAGERYQLARQRLLGDDTRMILDIG